MRVEFIGEVFPKTVEILGERGQRDLIGSFLREAPGFVFLGETDLSRWFPAYLKMRSFPGDVLEVAEYEYLKHLVRTADFGHRRLDPGQVGLNTSIQFIQLKGSQPKLQRSAGLYCFFRRDRNFVELQLSLEQAVVADLLHQERKFSIEQLVQQACMSPHIKERAETEWRTLVQDLLKIGMLEICVPMEV